MTDQVLLDTAERLFRDHCDKDRWDRAERGEFAQDLWQALKDNGFIDMGLPDSGFALADTYAILRIAGQHAAPLALAEFLLGARWTGQSEHRVSIGYAAAAQTAAQVPWGRSVEQVLMLPADSGPAATLEDQIALPLLQVETGRGTEGVNIAGEPRDTVQGVVDGAIDVQSPYALLSLARAVQMSGAMTTILEMALQYATERSQFGRTISKFQAIQHSLAVTAAEVAAAQRASDSAVAALDSERFVDDLAAAKARVGEAAGTVAELAHQVHGAMGFTHEHQLHHFTRRLWAWRDEFGHEGEWQALLGARIAAGGADQAWGFIASRA
ncbi:MAG: acyl-CoA dehydrogenase family protein [Pseudomonadales bacterium]